MNSIPASRKMHPQTYRDYLRVFFLHHLGNHEQMDPLIGGLRTLWDQVLNDSYDATAMNEMTFSDLPSQGSQLLVAYRAALMVIVAEDLRCIHHGRAADWVCQAIHGFVTNVEFPIQLTQVQSGRVGELKIVVSHVAFSMVHAAIDGKSLAEPLSVGDQTLVLDDSFVTPAISVFSDWSALKQSAHEQLDLLLDGLQERVAVDTADWKIVYRKGHSTRLNETMPMLVSWLVDREPVFYTDRVAATNLLRELGLDNPRREHSKKRKVKKRR